MRGIWRARSPARPSRAIRRRDRKSTRLNSSHANISYAVSCWKKKNRDISVHDTRNRQDHSGSFSQPFSPDGPGIETWGQHGSARVGAVGLVVLDGVADCEAGV